MMFWLKNRGVAVGEVSEETKQKIQAMTNEQLLEEITLGNKSHYQREKFDYLKTVYQLRISQEDTEHKQKTLEVAKEANNIATQALATSKNSYRIAIFAVVVSLVAIVVQYFWVK